jgi:hypothetical protein
VHTLQVRILNILYLWSLSFLLILGLVSLGREFDPEFRLVASSYHRKNDKTDLFFGHLDFTDGQAIFQQVQYSLVLHCDICLYDRFWCFKICWAIPLCCAFLLKMNIMSAPTILYYPPSVNNKPSEPRRYDASKQ